jgi:translation initiation factor 2 beta subunit (eIF-2beta)/eIF-5
MENLIHKTLKNEIAHFNKCNRSGEIETQNQETGRTVLSKTYTVFFGR